MFIFNIQLAPKWDERFEFRGFDDIYHSKWSLSELLSTPLELAVYHEDPQMFVMDDELGKVTVDLAALRHSREVTLSVPLSKETPEGDISQGDVSLTLSWEVEEPFDEGDAEAFAKEAEDIGLWVTVASIRARLQKAGFDADKERVAAAVMGRDFVRRRFAMEEVTFGQLPEPIIKVKGQLQNVGFDADAEVIAQMLGDRSSPSYHVGKCAKRMIVAIERELLLSQAAVKGRRPPGFSKKLSARGSGLVNRLKQSRASQVDMASLAVSINMLVKFILFELTGFLQVNSSIASSMPDLHWPPAFTELSQRVSSAVNLNFATEIGEANCELGSNYCFRVMTMMLALLAFQLAFPACIALVKFTPLRNLVTQYRLDTLVDRCYSMVKVPRLTAAHAHTHHFRSPPSCPGLALWARKEATSPRPRRVDTGERLR